MEKPMSELVNTSIATLERITRGSTPTATIASCLERFHLERTHPDVELIARAASDWIDDVIADMPPRWLSLMGNAGTGKTYVAKQLWAMVKSAKPWNPMSADYCPRFVYWPAFVERLREGNSYNELRDMQAWPYLFLDDIGSERDTTGFAAEKLMTLLGCRQGRWTVLTSNLTLSRMAQLESRMASRLVRDGSVAVSISAPDYALSRALRR